MTDKVQKIREEVVRMHNLLPVMDGDNISVNYADRICTTLEMYIDSLQEEPKECMYSKDNYTDEDKKALCDGCEEECRFNKKEESVSDSFEDEVKRLWKEINTGHSYSVVDSYNQFYGLCLDIAEWQKEQFEKDCANLCNGIAAAKGFAVAMAYDKGMADAKEQLMKNAIDTIVKVDAGGYPYVDRTIELYDYDKEIPLAKKGDKVKIIVIKED